MKRFIAIILFCIEALVAFAEPRNALLIANGQYINFAGLKNPIPEAAALANSLRQLGFTVTIKTNLSKEQIEDSLYDFQQIVEKTGGIAFFHYAGHAVQVNGENYLIPADADIPDERRVGTRCVNLDEVMASMQADTNIVVLDACRNNPLKSSDTRSTTRGLVPIKHKPRNSIIVYSAQADSVAIDGVFTPILTRKILDNKSFTNIIREVRKEVSYQTNNQQFPGSYDELYSEIFLNDDNCITELTAPVTRLILKQNAIVKLLIKGKEYNLKIEQLSPTVVIEYSNGKNLYAIRNMSHKIDLNNDGKNDLELVLNGWDKEVADLTFRMISHTTKLTETMDSVLLIGDNPKLITIQDSPDDFVFGIHVIAEQFIRTKSDNDDSIEDVYPTGSIVPVQATNHAIVWLTNAPMIEIVFFYHDGVFYIDTNNRVDIILIKWVQNTEGKYELLLSTIKEK